jgi:hypothetical protein
MKALSRPFLGIQASTTAASPFFWVLERTVTWEPCFSRLASPGVMMMGFSWWTMTCFLTGPTFHQFCR